MNDRGNQPRAQFSALMRIMSDGVIMFDAQGRVTELTPPAERLTGWPRAEALGRGHEELLPLRLRDGSRVSSPVRTALDSGGAVQRIEDCLLLARDGRKPVVRLDVACAFGDDGAVAGAICAIGDLTDQALLNEELQYRTSHDPLTGLLNREEFERRVRIAARQARATQGRHVLCYIDLDQFKIINDSLSHAAGDELLRQVAAAYRSRLRGTDVLARLGGDEFGVLLQHCELDRARAVVDDLLACLRDYRFTWGERAYSITASIGVAALAAGEDRVAVTFSQVDSACFAAKDAGRDRARFAADSDEVEQRHTEMGMAGRITAALEQNRFLLFYEDVVAVTEPHRVVYRELLVRLRGDDDRIVLPGRFIPAAERYSLMSAIDRWVLRETLRMLAARPPDAVIYAVNVSGQSIGDEKFLEFVRNSIAGSGVDPARLCIEMTETAAVSRLTDAVHFMRELGAMGVHFSLDDFGAGMASFAYLKNLPVDFLKIDGSFVRMMLHNRVDRGMVEAIHRIGHDMGVRTVAEHVEDLALLQELAVIGVDLAQGRAIAPARPF